ncbi:WhiB family transcriptional regulator, partial [Streptomyces sp. NPDC001617]
PALLQTVQAKAVCGRCPVRERCLEWAPRCACSGGCGGYEIRTREGLPPTRFPHVRLGVRD